MQMGLNDSAYYEYDKHDNVVSVSKPEYVNEDFKASINRDTFQLGEKLELMMYVYKDSYKILIQPELGFDTIVSRKEHTAMDSIGILYEMKMEKVGIEEVKVLLMWDSIVRPVHWKVLVLDSATLR